jgi:RNA polymerase sigma-70 factor (TIGR02943 family)
MEPNQGTNNQLNASLWVENYADYLYNFAFARVRRQDIAEDLVQDTFLSAYKAINTFQHNSSERTWLVAILKRKVIDHFRKKSTQKELNIYDRDTKDDFMGNFFAGEGQYEGHWRSSGAPNQWGGQFETQVDKNEFNGILQGCLGKLPEKWSAVFVLKNMDDMSSEEICKELDITPSNYWVMMHRAKLQLRECLEKNWVKK